MPFFFKISYLRSLCSSFTKAWLGLWWYFFPSDYKYYFNALIILNSLHLFPSCTQGKSSQIPSTTRERQNELLGHGSLSSSGSYQSWGSKRLGLQAADAWALRCTGLCLSLTPSLHRHAGAFLSWLHGAHQVGPQHHRGRFVWAKVKPADKGGRQDANSSPSFPFQDLWGNFEFVFS